MRRLSCIVKPLHSFSHPEYCYFINVPHPEATKIIYIFFTLRIFNLYPTKFPFDGRRVVFPLSQKEMEMEVEMEMGTGMQGNSFLIVFLLPQKVC